jgi:hypothetical protein
LQPPRVLIGFIETLARSCRVIKRFAPVGLILAVACGGGGGDGTGPVTKPSDISSMAVGDVRVLNPTDITTGIDLSAGSGARDYVIIVGNTASAKDVEASYVVKADKSSGASFGISGAELQIEHFCWPGSAGAHSAAGRRKPGARIRA